MQTEEEFDKLPVIYWNEILQVQWHSGNPYRRRPAKMHRTLKLSTAAWWIEKCFGIPMQQIDDWDTTTVRDLQQQLQQRQKGQQ